ncbi:MAG: hypothetical protein Q9195_009200 [Heterodermia aff. obscurata]
MKGLEQAVSIKLWAGDGTSAPWGKLKQVRDPELWDENGDTLVFFGHKRADPSFKIRSNLLHDSKSDVLIQMMRDGRIKTRQADKQATSIRYSLCMEAPSGGSRIDVLRYHITTRNFFAFMLRKPLVGFTFYQALVDLQDRLEYYLATTTDHVSALKSYLVNLGLVNVCNEPRAAAGLLAWSEDVRWNEGWREAFVHSVGMYERISQLQESADISLATNAHLQRAHLELQARVQEAEVVLSKFYFDDAHFAQEDLSPSVRATSDRFRKFLRQFYEKEYQSWPIRKGQQSNPLWLDRAIVSRLQDDFSALYEYFVNRNVVWNDEDDTEDRRARNWLKSTNNLNFGLDGEDYRMLGVFRNLESRLIASHIPHPYPLLPNSVPAVPAAKKSKFRGKKIDKPRESRVAHGYAISSNLHQLSRKHAKNGLAQAFIHFEKADNPGEVDPREARRERWIIIYCVLQTLAGLSVDVPSLSFKGNVSYFLNASLHGLPPWNPTEQIFMDATREQSHCWLAPEIWEEEQYDRWASSGTKSIPSSGRSESSATYDSRPLSPESESMISTMATTVDSSGVATFYNHESLSELETTETHPRHIKSAYLDSPCDPDLDTVQQREDTYFTARSAVPSLISRYSSKPLPMRPPG